MTDRPSSIDRRTALQTLGSLTLAGVAGCLGNDGSTPSSSSTTGGTPPFADVHMQGTRLVVELASSADVEHVNLVTPNGSLFGTRGVAQGASRITFDVGTTYTPGEYEIVAVDGDQTLGTTTRQLRPDLQILDMGIGRNHPKRMWNGTSGEIADEAFITVQNQGSGPIAVTKLLLIGDVPLPSTKRGTNYVNNSDVSGIYDPGTDSTTPKVVVPPGERSIAQLPPLGSLLVEPSPVLNTNRVDRLRSSSRLVSGTLSRPRTTSHTLGQSRLPTALSTLVRGTMVSLIDVVLQGFKDAVNWFISLFMQGLTNGYQQLSIHMFGSPTPQTIRL